MLDATSCAYEAMCLKTHKIISRMRFLSFPVADAKRLGAASNSEYSVRYSDPKGTAKRVIVTIIYAQMSKRACL